MYLRLYEATNFFQKSQVRLYILAITLQLLGVRKVINNEVRSQFDGPTMKVAASFSAVPGAFEIRDSAWCSISGMHALLLPAGGAIHV